jgi:hypothetical protein
VSIESFDDENKTPRLTRCNLDGQCAEPKSQPFELWPEQHERTLFSTATKNGVVAVMYARAGNRWGAYLAQSTDGGETFELPRLIGEGKIDLGFYEMGALVAFSEKTLLLLSANRSGSSQRGWYVLASSDGGTHWGPP